MNKRKLLLRGTCSLLLGGMFLVGNVPEAAAQAEGSFWAGVYNGRLDRHSTMHVYQIAGQDDVPYVPIVDYLSDLYDNDITFSAEGSKLVATRNNTKVSFDIDTGVISCDAWDDFFGSYDDKALPNGILGSGEFNAKAVSTKHPSTETQDHGFSIDLASYGLSMEVRETYPLLPFAVLQNIFAVPYHAGNFSFNGSDFYNVASTYNFVYGDYIDPDVRLNPYANAYYSGEFSTRKEIPPAYARYAYGSTCLLLDLYYGHKEDLGIERFDDYIEQNGLKEKMLSSDPSQVSEGFKDLVFTLFDSGHDGVNLSNNVYDKGRHIKTGRIFKAYGGFGPMDEAMKKLIYRLADKGVDFMAGDMGTHEQYKAACQELKLDPILLEYIFRDDSGRPYEEWLEKCQYHIETRNTDPEDEDSDPFNGITPGPNQEQYYHNAKRMHDLKPKDFGSARVDFFDDTAFIYFEEFADNNNTSSFYYHMPEEDIYADNTFGLFYDAFDKIQSRPGIRKVVIDLANNSGGRVSSLVDVLGFISPDGEANITYYNTLNKNYCSEWYHVDTNLDGKFDSQDGFGDRYKFYIMTSGVSYSCANALPFYAQEAGLAKIIGEQPGGGDCMVTNFLDAYGNVANMSGIHKFSKIIDGKIVSDEDAVKVDYPFGDQADDLYFNYRRLAQWLKDKH